LRALQQRLPTSQLHGLDLSMPLATAPDDPAALDRELLSQPSVLDPVRVLVGLVQDREAAAVPVGVYGAFAFDLVDHFEPLGARRADPSEDADIEVVLGLDVVRYDERRHVVQIVTRGLPWEAVATVQERHATTLQAVRATALRPPVEEASQVTCSPAVSAEPD